MVMPSLSSWDCIFYMLGDIKLECISISPFEDDMGHPTTETAQGASGSGAWEIDPDEQPPIFTDMARNINKTTKLSWYEIYKEFAKRDIPETQEDFHIYINIKRLRLHKVAAHPPVFSCAEIIKWILQCTNTKDWMIRGHDGAPIVAIASTNINTYYKLPEKQYIFNTKWLAEFTTPTKDILRGWWQEPVKF